MPMHAVWSVRDGLLICKGKPLGYLGTAQAFTNVRMVVEWRWAPGKPPGYSGVLLRITSEPARFQKIPNHQLAGDITIVRKLAPLENPPGDWNRCQIELRGESHRAWDN